MNETVLRKPNGTFLAVIRTEPSGIQKIYNSTYTYAGQYKPDSNLTYDAIGRLVGRGNLLSSLVV